MTRACRVCGYTDERACEGAEAEIERLKAQQIERLRALLGPANR